MALVDNGYQPLATERGELESVGLHFRSDRQIVLARAQVVEQFFGGTLIDFQLDQVAVGAAIRQNRLGQERGTHRLDGA